MFTRTTKVGCNVSATCNLWANRSSTSTLSLLTVDALLPVCLNTLTSVKLLSARAICWWYGCTFIKVVLWFHQRFINPPGCRDLDVQIGNPTSMNSPLHLPRSGDVIRPSLPCCLLVSGFKASCLSSPSQISHLMSSRADQVNNWWRTAGERHRSKQGCGSKWSREGDTSGGWAGAGTSLQHPVLYGVIRIQSKWLYQFH